jgi:hypothetical protein
MPFVNLPKTSLLNCKEPRWEFRIQIMQYALSNRVFALGLIVSGSFL